MVVWFTGISGSGKTTLGKKFFQVLKKKSQSTIFLDGDEFRAVFKNDLKYSLKDRNLKIKRKLSLGTGPFMASYSMMFDYLNKIPFICYPLITICFLMDWFLMLFHKNRINKFYPICILIVAEK